MAFVASMVLLATELGLRVFWTVPLPLRGLEADTAWWEPEPGEFEVRPGYSHRIRVAAPLDPTPEAASASGEIVTRVSPQGLRGPELGDKRPGERRLLFGGDSLTFGLGVEVEQCYPELTARLLDERGMTCTACNAAMPGYGFAATCRRLLRLRERFGADVLVAAYFLGNDFPDDILQRTGIVVSGRLFDGPLGNLMRSSRRARLCVHSRLALFVEAWLIGHQPAWSLLPQFVPTPEQTALMATLPDGFPIGGLYLDAPRGHSFRTGAAPLVDCWLHDLEHTLLTFRQAAGGMPALIVILPAQYHLDADLRAQSIAEQHLDGRLLQLGSAQQHIAALCGELGLRCVDATPVLAAAGRPASLYDKDHIHLSVRGHQVVAQAIVEATNQLLRR